MWSASQNCSSLTNSFHIYEWADSPPDGAVQSMPACVFFSSVCVCVLQVCTLHTSRTWTKMKKSSNSFRRWALHVLHIALLLLLNDCSHTLQSFFNFLFGCFSGRPTKETLAGPECNSSALLPRIDTKLHHSSGSEQWFIFNYYICLFLRMFSWWYSAACVSQCHLFNHLW